MFKIGTYLPDWIVSNEDLEYLGWSAKKIYAKTGIRQRHQVEEGQSALDLAQNACENLFGKYDLERQEIDYLLYCTQSPDYIIPASVNLLHKRLGLRGDTPSLEYNHGCSGYIYGLSLAKALIESGLASKLLLVTSDTYSRYIDENDRTNKTIFGDGATATLLDIENVRKFGNFIFETNGDGACNLCVNKSGLSDVVLSSEGMEKKLYMNGGEIFNFTLDKVPTTIQRVLERNSVGFDEIDYFIFHQANDFMLEYLRQKLEVPVERFPKYLENIGNTVSSTIPFLLNNMNEKELFKSGDRLLLIGFGVGYSLGATVIEY